MSIKLDQSSYWNKVANQKNFNHELDWSFIQKNIEKESMILDYGCGYGRLVRQFFNQGYKNVVGVDSSDEMIKRGLKTNIGLEISHIENNRIPFPDRTFDLVLLFAVLTCIPFDEDQATLMHEIKRVLRPEGILYVSDLLINPDKRNQERYEKTKKGPFGVFELDEGAVLRHHDKKYLIDQTFKGFDLLYKKDFEVVTMNGNCSKAIQMIGKKTL